MGRVQGQTRQDQAARTRSSIIDAAATEFDLHGYTGARLTAIVEQAGVAKGALYFHFSSKEELARVIIDQQFVMSPPDELYAVGLQGLVDLTYQVAAAIIEDVRVRAAIRLVIEHASFTAPLADPYRSWIQVVERFLREAGDHGQLRDGVSPHDTAVLVVGAFTGIQLTSEVLTGRSDLNQRLHDLWSALGPALAVPAELAGLRWSPPPPAASATDPARVSAAPIDAREIGMTAGQAPTG